MWGELKERYPANAVGSQTGSWSCSPRGQKLALIFMVNMYEWPCLATVGRDHIHDSWTAKTPLPPSHGIHSGLSLSSHSLLLRCPAFKPPHLTSTGFLKLVVVDSETTSVSVQRVFRLRDTEMLRSLLWFYLHLRIFIIICSLIHNRM